jgi:glucose-1-phosphate thymidylyltransferase
LGNADESACVNGWIDKAVLAESTKQYGKSPYGQYLLKVVKGKIRIE